LHHWEKVRGDWPALHKRVLAFKFIPTWPLLSFLDINSILYCFMSNVLTGCDGQPSVVYFIDVLTGIFSPLHKVSFWWHSGGSRFESRPTLTILKFFVVFMVPPGDCRDCILKGYDPLLLHPLQRIINHLTIWHYIVWGTDIQPINKVFPLQD
jgi:hypothetical protein